MARHYSVISPEEIKLLEQCNTSREYINLHFATFRDFYTDSIITGAKRAQNIWYRRDEYLADMERKKHLVEIKSKAVVAKQLTDPRADSLPDVGDTLIKILNEFKVHTKQVDELIAESKKQTELFLALSNSKSKDVISNES